MKIIKKGYDTLIDKYAGWCSVCSQETVALKNELTFSDKGYAAYDKCSNCGNRVFYRLMPKGGMILNENSSTSM